MKLIRYSLLMVAVTLAGCTSNTLKKSDSTWSEIPDCLKFNSIQKAYNKYKSLKGHKSFACSGSAYGFNYDNPDSGNAQDNALRRCVKHLAPGDEPCYTISVDGKAIQPKNEIGYRLGTERTIPDILKNAPQNKDMILSVYKRYLRANNNKAFAYSPSGHCAGFWGMTSIKDATAKALQSCTEMLETGDPACQLIHVNGDPVEISGKL